MSGESSASASGRRPYGTISDRNEAGTSAGEEPAGPGDRHLGELCRQADGEHVARLSGHEHRAGHGTALIDARPSRTRRGASSSSPGRESYSSAMLRVIGRMMLAPRAVIDGMPDASVTSLITSEYATPSELPPNRRTNSKRDAPRQTGVAQHARGDHRREHEPHRRRGEPRERLRHRHPADEHERHQARSARATAPGSGCSIRPAIVARKIAVMRQPAGGHRRRSRQHVRDDDVDRNERRRQRARGDTLRRRTARAPERRRRSWCRACPVASGEKSYTRSGSSASSTSTNGRPPVSSGACSIRGTRSITSSWLDLFRRRRPADP